MKFLINNNNVSNTKISLFSKNFFFEFTKKSIFNRKYLNKSRKNVINIFGKNSLIRERNYNYFNKFIKLTLKNGCNYKVFKSINFFYENLFILFINDESKLNNFYRFYFFKYLVTKNDFFFDENNLFLENLNGLESVFEIKTKKITKKMNIKTENKYLYELVYNSPKKRFKYILRNLKFYLNSFGNYKLKDRLFWAFINSFTNKKNSFLSKKKIYTHVKSIKFFKKK